MQPNQLVIIDHHKTISLNVEKMAIYLQSKIIEAYDQNHQVYYVFFYKDHYLTAAKTTKLIRHSHIERAFKKGIIVPSYHPLVKKLISSDLLYKKRTFLQVIAKMEKILPPHEMANLATFFESFIPRKKIFTYIQNLFYEYRRNGQMFLSYRIIRILMDFTPTHSFVKELSNHLDFIKFAKLYHQGAEIILDKDPIYAEKVFFSNMEDKAHFQKLSSLLEQQSRWTDLIAVYIHQLTQNREYFPPLLLLLENHLQEEEVVQILEDLFNQIPDQVEIQQYLLKKYFHLHQTEKILFLLSSQNLKLNEVQTMEFIKLLEDFNFEVHHDHLEKLHLFFSPFFTLNPKKAEDFLQKWIIQLLSKGYDIPTIKTMLASLRQVKEAVPLLMKIEKMHNLANDPDQQLLLGQLYYQFKQYNQAIECFSWEMELRSVDPKPVQWLSKIYNELGMKQEYMAYQQLCIDMQKRA
ncbi:MAG: tetratricopeptide repeat protein [Heyndrickxia sp.]